MLGELAWAGGIVIGWVLIEIIKFLVNQANKKKDPPPEDHGILGFTVQVLAKEQREIRKDIHQLDIKVSTTKTETEEIAKKIDRMLERFSK